MNFCLLLTGHYRNFDNMYQNFENKLLKPNNISDIYMHTYDNYGFRKDLTKQQHIPPHGSLHKATFDDEKINIDWINSKYVINTIIENYNEVSNQNLFKIRGEKIKKLILNKFGQDRRTEVLFSQYYKRLKGLKFIEESNKNYDLIFSTRPDFRIDTTLILDQLDPEYVYMSLYTRQDGYHDFYIIGNIKNLKKIYNMFYSIENELCDKICEVNINSITCPHFLLTTWINTFTDVKVKEINLLGYIER
jgi:hypothetical protein